MCNLVRHRNICKEIHGGHECMVHKEYIMCHFNALIVLTRFDRQRGVKKLYFAIQHFGIVRLVKYDLEFIFT